MTTQADVSSNSYFSIPTSKYTYGIFFKVATVSRSLSSFNPISGSYMFWGLEIWRYMHVAGLTHALNLPVL